MKRLTLFLFLFVLMMAFAALPMVRADARATPSAEQTLSQPATSPAMEKSELSFADTPVWAQILVVSVVGLFALTALVPLLGKDKERTVLTVE